MVDKPIKKRREILSDAIEEIPNRVVLSEMKVEIISDYTKHVLVLPMFPFELSSSALPSSHLYTCN